MTDEPLDLDKHRGMAAQKATELRRVLAEVENHAKELRDRQAVVENHMSAPATCWPDAGRQGGLRLKSVCRGIVAGRYPP